MDDIIEHLARLDAWLERDEGGSVPIDLLRERGLQIPEASTLDDAMLAAKLWQIIEAMSEIGMYLSSTDHMSDRELYERLLSDILPTEAFLEPDDPCSGDHYDLIGGTSEEDILVYLTYYAENDERRDWQSRFGEALPRRSSRPFDRDRLLPTIESRLARLRNN